MISTCLKMFRLTTECQEVIGMRMLKAARGGSEAVDEMALMISEKVDAAVLYGPRAIAGGSMNELIDDYRGIVQSNALRLAVGRQHSN